MKELRLTDFTKSNFEDWNSAAQRQLKKEDPQKELAWESGGVSNLKPYYDATDLKPLSKQVEFFQNLSHHQWKLYEEIAIESEKEANMAALEGLIGGCDGIIFNSKKNVDILKLLKDIETSICDISMFGTSQKGIATRMDSTNTLVESISSSPANQISSILNDIIDQKHIYRYAFPDFFLEIASVRALRYLLASEKKLHDVLIHSAIQLNANPEYQWFTNTTTGLAAILGGSHSISLVTAIGERRITRNVGNLIREESNVTSYTDQCGGSYFVESLTAKIVQSVKELLREQ